MLLVATLSRFLNSINKVAAATGSRMFVANELCAIAIVLSLRRCGARQQFHDKNHPPGGNTSCFFLLRVMFLCSGKI